MKNIIYLSIALMLATFATNALAKNPVRTAKMKDVMAKEQKTMLLSRLRANPEPRSAAIYNIYPATEPRTLTSAKLD
jgi:hypothetical protein